VGKSRRKPEPDQRGVAALEALEERQGRIEAALRASELRYKFLYEENPSMYFTVDTEGRVLSVNPFGAEQLGYAVADLVGRPVLQVFHGDDRESVERQLRVCVDNAGKPFNWEFRKVHSDGHVLWVREVARAVRDQDGRTIVLIVCEDITSRKAMEEELRRARDEMEQRVAERTLALRQSQQELSLLAGRLLTAQEDERRRLAREMHDDLTQRLAGVAMQAARLERLRAQDSPEVPGLIQEIRVALGQLSTDVHALSRRLHPSTLGDLGLVEVLGSECTNFSRMGQVVVSFEPADVPADIDKDTAVCLYRIAQEGLRNVAKHARTDRARVALKGGDGALTLTVEDQGVGFDPAAASGVGLGLASMSERARLIQAEFAVVSRPGAGTRVSVRVPRERVLAGRSS
jgi:PAS domain S-box-containing protein